MKSGFKMLVAVRFPLGEDREYRVVTSRNLKGLCEEIGLGYGEGRKMGLDEGKVGTVSLGGRFWLLKDSDVVVRVKGRGGLRSGGFGSGF